MPALAYQKCDRTGLYYVQLTIERRLKRFLIDTGASHTILRGDLIDTSRLISGRQARAMGVAEVTILRVSVRFNFLGKTIYEARTAEFLNHLPEDGIIGHDILSQFSSVLIDYKNRLIRFTE